MRTPAWRISATASAAERGFLVGGAAPVRQRNSAENLQPPRAAKHIAITKKRVGSTRRNMVRVLAVFGQKPVGVSRQLVVVAAGIVRSCNV